MVLRQSASWPSVASSSAPTQRTSTCSAAATAAHRRIKARYESNHAAQSAREKCLPISPRHAPALAASRQSGSIIGRNMTRRPRARAARTAVTTALSLGDDALPKGTPDGTPPSTRYAGAVALTDAVYHGKEKATVLTPSARAVASDASDAGASKGSGPSKPSATKLTPAHFGAPATLESGEERGAADEPALPDGVRAPAKARAACPKTANAVMTKRRMLVRNREETETAAAQI